jgi:hypothetical protein
MGGFLRVARITALLKEPALIALSIRVPLIGGEFETVGGE